MVDMGVGKPDLSNVLDADLVLGEGCLQNLQVVLVVHRCIDEGGRISLEQGNIDGTDSKSSLERNAHEPMALECFSFVWAVFWVVERGGREHSWSYSTPYSSRC